MFKVLFPSTVSMPTRGTRPTVKVSLDSTKLSFVIGMSVHIRASPFFEKTSSVLTDSKSVPFSVGEK